MSALTVTRHAMYTSIYMQLLKTSDSVTIKEGLDKRKIRKHNLLVFIPSSWTTNWWTAKLDSFRNHLVTVDSIPGTNNVKRAAPLKWQDRPSKIAEKHSTNSQNYGRAEELSERYRPQYKEELYAWHHGQSEDRAIMHIEEIRITQITRATDKSILQLVMRRKSAFVRQLISNDPSQTSSRLFRVPAPVTDYNQS